MRAPGPRPAPPWARLSPIGRSLWLYHGDAGHALAMDALYSRFVRADGLVFDLGAHVGDRVASFRRLGARVVALEPQPRPARAIRLLFHRDPGVTLLRAAASDRDGTLVLHVNSRNPTVSTASRAFVSAAGGARGWESQVWDGEISVPAVTLDGLVARFGRPDFVKIDVEGFEDRVLGGLSIPLPALSFEFTTIAPGAALRCLDRLERLGPYRFDVSIAETQRLVFGRPVDAAAMAAYLGALPHEANSGDVYAALP